MAVYRCQQLDPTHQEDDFRISDERNSSRQFAFVASRQITRTFVGVLRETKSLGNVIYNLHQTHTHSASSACRFINATVTLGSVKLPVRKPFALLE